MIRQEWFFRLSCLPAITRRGPMMTRRVLSRALCSLISNRPIKIGDNALNRVLYTHDDLSRFASDESCFEYNIRDAMPSICYDDDSANEKNHRGNRRNCIDAAPFSLWLVTSFFFVSFLFSFFPSRTHRHRRSYRSIVIVAPGVSTKSTVYPSDTRGLVGGSRDIESDDSPRGSPLAILQRQLFGPQPLDSPAMRHKDAFFSRGCTTD